MPPPPISFQPALKLTLFGKNVSIVPYELLDECVTETYFDYIFVSGNEGYVINQLKNLGIEKQKIVNMSLTSSFLLTYHVRLIRQIKSNISKYKILFVGLSYVRDGIDLSCFDLPAVVCAGSSQDLFYDYEYIKRMLSEENNQFKYVFIGLAPYSFNFDLSLGNNSNFILGYYLAFKKTHNFQVNDEDMEKIFNDQHLNLFETLDKINYPFDLDLNDLYKWKKQNNHPMDVSARFGARERAEVWSKKRFPLTIAENTKILKECIHFCRSKNTIPILVLYPKSHVYMRFFSKRMLDEFYYILNQIKEEEKIEVLDYTQWNEITINDFYNVDHLNSSGAKKVSTAINDYIMNKR